MIASATGSRHGIVFVLSGHGCQWDGMAIELLDASPLFARHMHACEQALNPHVGWSLVDVLRGRPRARKLQRVDVVQPALFAVTVSLAELWRSCGVRPDAVVGHSQGEVAAAYLAGGLSLADAAMVVARRSRELARLSGKGGMAALSIASDRLTDYLEPFDKQLEPAAVNGPGSFAVAGPREPVSSLLETCKASGVRAGKVAIDYASHSSQVEPLRDRLLHALSTVAPRSGEIPFFSTVTGGLLDTAACDAEHWYRAERQTVQFEQVMRVLLRQGHRTFVEISPHPVLIAAMQETVDHVVDEDAEVLVTGSLRRGQGSPRRFLASLSEVYEHGVAVDWQAASSSVGVDEGSASSRVELHVTDQLDGSPMDGPPAVPGEGSLRSRIQGMSEAERARTVGDAVVREVASTLGLPALDDTMTRQAFKELGLDSAGIVELRNRLRTLTGLRVSATLVFDHPTPAALAGCVLEELSGARARPSAPGAARPSISTGPPDEPIAIVGMSCRFPGGVSSPRDLWDLVARGGDAIADFPADRGWDLEALYDPDPDRPGTVYAREGGFVYDAGHFDASFFGISPREALMMDPQQRMFLEGCWEAIEHAGIDPLSLTGSRTGVFAGSNIRDYNASQWMAPNGLEGHSLTGTAGSILSGRVAYTLGLEGPALTVDTACSSSLVTLHLACAALRNGECSLALAGGVTVITTPGLFAAFSRQRALARDGRCKSFADSADGTGWGEGVGVLLVERLCDAQSRGHSVLALVRGSAVNQDGASNGLTAPSGTAQQQVIRQALQDARLSPEDVDVVEAHGTGTTLGDPIEAHALLATYGQRSPERPLWLGSVKSNMGHTQAAAGVAGLIKMVMAIRHGRLPRTLHVDRPSSEVEWSTGAVALLTEERPWTSEGRPRRAGVSSYGISGTNAHVILEQAEEDRGEQAAASADQPLHARVVPWPISGRSAVALRAQAERLRAFTIAAPELRPQDIAFSLAGRSAFEHRAVVFGGDREDLLSGLSELAAAEPSQEWRPGEIVTGATGHGAPTAFLFSGQGSQRAGMGRELYDAFPAFKAAFDEACGHLDGLLGRSLRDVVFGEGEDLNRSSSGEILLDRTLFTQTGLFALEVALFRLLQTWGARPDFLIGHSIGELAAAHVAGVFSLEDACRLVAARGQLMEELPAGGAMLAVQASEAEIAPWLAEQGSRIALAAVNGPRAIVISGDEDAVLAAARVWEQRGRKTKRLRVSHAFHSPRMNAMLESFERIAETVSFCEPAIPIVSNLTGRIAEPRELCAPGYWVRHVREPVRFASGVQWLETHGVHSFLELGPDGVLGAMTSDCLTHTDPEQAPAVVVPLLRSGREETKTLLEALARAWVGGLAVGWEAICEQNGGRRVELPTYAFQRERYWLDLPQGYWIDERGQIVAPAPGVQATGDDSPEREFWQAVASGDAGALAEVLRVQTDDRRSSLESVLPALSEWHQRRSEDSIVQGWRYRVRWKPVSDLGSGALSGLWPLIAPAAAEDRVVAELTGALEAHGARVLVITVDQAALDRTALAEQLSSALAEQPQERDQSPVRFASASQPADRSAVQGVLSLLALEETRCEGYESVPRGMAGTLMLAQAMGDVELQAPLWIVTRAAVSAASSDRVEAPIQRMAWGMGRTMRLEDPQRWGGLVDLPHEIDRPALDRLCVALSSDTHEDEMAVRPAGVFSRRLSRCAAERDIPPGSWRPTGTVLVTGGTGALGGHLARWLARAGAKHLVLSARRGSEAPGAADLERELAELGAEARVVACDVADREQLQGLLESIGGDRPLSGVFHAAGVLDDELIGKLTLDRVDRVLRPKLDGALHLHELTAELDLNAFVLFSSIAATLGGGGQAAYAAGNAFLNALTDCRRLRGLPVTSIAWGAWAGAGMAAGVSEHMQRRGVLEMAPEAALLALGQALDGNETDVVVADLDWERYARFSASTRLSPALSDLPELRQLVEGEAQTLRGAEERKSLTARLEDVAESERGRVVLELVQAQAAIVLGHPSIEAVHPRQAFREMGFDSLSGVELRNRLMAVTGVQLPTTVVFDFPTATELSGHLLDEASGTRPSTATVTPASRTEEPMAIVGMGCRFPGDVDSPEGLWDLVASGSDAISEFPTDRSWDMSSVYDPDPESLGTTYAREGGFLHDAGDFDAAFFGIGPREALAMSPQQRLLLEVSWEALEKANIDPHSLKGTNTGVFVGESLSDYSTGLFGSASQEVKGYLGTGTAGSIVSGRVAYALGLEGVAVTINTACSSSLVALHLASGALRDGECGLALVGGVTVMATPSVFIDFSRQRGTAPDGRCKPFADRADGAGWGEGVGIVVLERLSDAERNGHEVLAVVRGSAVNQDGASNGLTAPNGPSQQRVIRQALSNARLSPRDIDAVEAHGTGTKLGDPIEAQAILATYGQDRELDHPLWLGSIKSNIGHTQAAAGIAGMIKMVMALRHERLPRTLHVDRPSGQIDWSSNTVSLLTEDVPWSRNGRPRRAAVSSFGISGTNAHVILEEPAAAERTLSPSAETVTSACSSAAVTPWVLSARSSRALQAQAGRLREHLRVGSDSSLAAVGLSLACRAGLEYRAVVLGEQRKTLLDGLGSLADDSPAPAVASGVASAGNGPLAFLFTGQGAQHAGMGSQLYDVFSVFREALDEVCGLLDLQLECSLRELMFAPDGSQQASMLNETAFTQTSLFALEVALFRLLESWGVRPGYLIGHSVGELAAAHVAGVFSLPDACALVAARAGLMGALPQGGAMVAMEATEAELRESISELPGELALAAVNGPRSIVVSGEEEAVLELAETWRRRGRKTRRLRVSHAFHSARMDGMLRQFSEVAEGMSFAPPRIPIVSNLTGCPIAAEELCTARYWVRHVRETVRFADGVRWLQGQGVRSFLELGPDGVLSAMVQECLGDGALSDHAGGVGAGSDDSDRLAGERTPITAAPALRAGHPETTTLLSALAGIWVAGTDVNWRKLFDESATRPADLPTYAFQRERFWLDSVEQGVADAEAVGQASAGHPLLGAAVALADETGWLFTGRLSLQTHPWLADHVVLGKVLLPGTAFLELALYAAGELGCEAVRELTLRSPLVLPQDGALQLQVSVGRPDEYGARPLSVYSRPEGATEDAVASEWVCHAAGSLASLEGDEQTPAGAQFAEDGVWPPAGAEPAPVEDIYDRLAEGGLDYGPTFQGLTNAWRRGEEIFAEATLAGDELDRAGSFGVHPALLDAALHATALAAQSDAVKLSGQSADGQPGDESSSYGVRLPFCWTDVKLFSRGASALRVRFSPAAGDALAIAVADSDGRALISVGSLATRSASAAGIARAASRQDGLFQLHWKPIAIDTARSRNAHGDRWALVGLGGPDSHPTLQLESGGEPVEAYADLAYLRGAVESGRCAVPEVVLLDCTTLGGTLPDGTTLGETLPDGTALGGTLPDSAHVGVAQVLGAVQRLLGEEHLGDARLVVLTCGAQAVHEGEDVRDLAAATAWGLVRSAQAEHPRRFVLIDVDRERSSLEALPAVLGEDEPQVAIRGGKPSVPRLARPGSDEALTPPSGAPQWRLDVSGASTFEGLAMVACPEVNRPLEPEEIRVEVRAAGVNFKDVLIALGVYPGKATIGNEAAGVVSEVGSAVKDLAPGERVTGLFAGAFGPRAITDGRLVTRIPTGWSFAQAASMPLVFLTAYYALVDLATVRPHERLLVHSAAGGVGMAAVQLARHLDVEVFATASAAKWPVLEERGLDTAHIASSRELDFRERFLEQTAGAGVDVVLNSLAGEFIDASLELLPRGGRFVEMGKTDVRDPSELAAEHEGVLYRAFDLMDAGPARIKEMFADLMDLFETGELQLTPIRAWDVRRAPEALRFMSQARHVGKMVLKLPVRDIDSDGTVLITGGTGGLGGLLAKHLVSANATRHLLLASRAGEAAPGAEELQKELTQLGASVRIVRCDVSQRDQLQALIASVAAEHPLRGVVHAAGVLHDSLIDSLSPELLQRVLAPKLDAAWHLHELTAQMELDAFVLFSSVAGTLGSPGQGNYAAANSFLDALALHRRAQGLAAVAMAWGPWEQATGMTSQLGHADLGRMASSGMLTLSRAQGLDLFDEAYGSDRALNVLARLDTAALRERARDGELPSMLGDLIRRPARAERATTSASGSLIAQVTGASEAERGRLVLEFVRNQTAAVLGHASSDAIDSNRTFKDLGFDSLAAVELRNRLGAATGLRLPATLVFDYPTLGVLAGHIRDELSAASRPTQSAELDLDELALTLSSLSAEQAHSTGIAARLQDILSGWAGVGEPPEQDLEDDDLSLAPDEEIFELIDREFGVS